MNKKGFICAVIISVIGMMMIVGTVIYFYSTNIPHEKTFSLIDHNGKAVTEQDFRGHFMLILFGYTYCPDICPTGLTVMSESLDILGKDGDKVVPIFITIDPERDTPEVLKDYVPNFHPRLIGLTGTTEQVAAAAKTYNAKYLKIKPLDQKEEDAGGYYMGHSTSTYLTGPNGENIITFDRNTKAKAMAKSIGNILKHFEG